MKKIINYRDSVIGWYIQTMFVYTAKLGGISELDSEMNELYEIGRIHNKENT